MKTKLLYLEDDQVLQFSARITGLSSEEDKTIVILDQTHFYPQGGGQPYDQGEIRTDSGVMIVEEVYHKEGVVQHIGYIEQGEIIQGDQVIGVINKERRLLHTRIHSAGHVIDFGSKKAGYSWTPIKGFHAAEGSYVEYMGVDNEINKEEVIKKIEQASNLFIKENHPVVKKMMHKEELGKYCEHVPDYLPEDKPSRVVLFGDKGVPCGGTHVSSLQEIGEIQIRKIKCKKGVLRVSYKVV